MATGLVSPEAVLLSLSFSCLSLVDGGYLPVSSHGLFLGAYTPGVSSSSNEDTTHIGLGLHSHD